MKPQEIIALIKQEVKPALGCTEPIAVALAVAKAAEIISENCPCGKDWRLKADFRLDIAVSGNILKNGMGVGIPGTGMVGLPVAAALGAVCGDSSLGLEVLSGLTPEAVERAKELVSKGCVHISVADTEHLLYVKATVSVEGGLEASAEVDPHAYAVIEDDHDRIVETSFADRMLMSSESAAAAQEHDHQEYDLTVKDLWDFALSAPYGDISFILGDRDLNLALAQEGLRGDYGLRVGKAIRENQKEVFGDNFLSYAMGMTAAASDARMAGCTLPAMSNSGSGNQGITVSMPVIAYALKYKVDDEPGGHPHQALPGQTERPVRLRGGFYGKCLRHRLSAGRQLSAGVRRHQEHGRKHHRNGVRRSQGGLRDEGGLRRFVRGSVGCPGPQGHLYSLHRRYRGGRRGENHPQHRCHRICRNESHRPDDPGHHALQVI